MTRPTIVYHGGCKDGVGAAWAARLHFKDDAHYVQYFPHRPTLPTFEPGSDVWLLDCCPRAQAIVEILDAGHRVTIIDHHDSTREILAAIQNQNLTAVFDMEKSACVLVWEHFFPKRKVPLFLLYIQDRDIWGGVYEESEAFNEALWALPLTFDLYDQLAKRPSDVEQLVKSGSLLVGSKRRHIEHALERAYFTEIGGYEVPVVNTDSHVSDVGHRLAALYPDRAFAGVWYLLADGRQKWSLRSVSNFNVARVAERYGGGGHARAAGFTR